MNTTLVWKESLLAIVFKKLLNIIILLTALWCHICPPTAFGMAKTATFMCRLQSHQISVCDFSGYT